MKDQAPPRRLEVGNQIQERCCRGFRVMVMTAWIRQKSYARPPFFDRDHPKKMIRETLSTRPSMMPFQEGVPKNRPPLPCQLCPRSSGE